MQDATLSTMGIGIVYEDTEEAEDNLASRLKSGSQENKEEIAARLEQAIVDLFIY